MPHPPSARAPCALNARKPASGRGVSHSLNARTPVRGTLSQAASVPPPCAAHAMIIRATTGATTGVTPPATSARRATHGATIATMIGGTTAATMALGMR